MSKLIEKQIKKIYENVFKQVFNRSNLTNLYKGSTDQIELQMVKFASSKQYQEFAKKFAIELAKKGLNSQRGIWRKYFEAAKKSRYIALPKTFNEFELNVMKKAVENNFKMITSIPNEVMNNFKYKYINTLINEVAKNNISRGSFRKQLEKTGNTHAKVIARTEAAKLQTVILQNRALDLGSVAYIWLASNDKRTRPSHKAMNGVVVFWNHNKPLLDNMTGHAGEFPNCRCSPQPIFDEFDLQKPFYKVYDYRTNNIVSMSKKELLEALNRNSL